MKTQSGPRMEFHIARTARVRYRFDESLFALTGNYILVDAYAARVMAQKMNAERDLARFPERTVRAGELNAMGLLDEISHYIVAQYREQINSQAMAEALDWIVERLGRRSSTLPCLLCRGLSPLACIAATSRPPSTWRGDVRHAEPPGAPGRDADALAGEPESGLCPLSGTL